MYFIIVYIAFSSCSREKHEVDVTAIISGGSLVLTKDKRSVAVRYIISWQRILKAFYTYELHVLFQKKIHGHA